MYKSEADIFRKIALLMLTALSMTLYGCNEITSVSKVGEPSEEVFIPKLTNVDVLPDGNKVFSKQDPMYKITLAQMQQRVGETITFRTNKDVTVTVTRTQ